MNRVLFALLLLFLMPANALGDIDATVIQNFNFGTLVQTSSTAAITIETNGAQSSLSGVSVSAAGSNAIINYANNSLLQTVADLSADDTVSLSADSCSLTISNITFSQNNFRLYPYGIMGDKSRDVNIGATLTVSGFCAAGTYIGSFNINGSKTPATVTVSVTFEDKISITNKQDMNFGTIMSPASAGMVVLATNGQRTAVGDIYLSNNTEVANGLFTINGTTGRTVNVSFPAEINIYSGGNSMVVNNFTADTGSVFTLETDTVDMPLGATLNVPANAAAGEYSGEYTIMVSY